MCMRPNWKIETCSLVLVFALALCWSASAGHAADGIREARVAQLPSVFASRDFEASELAGTWKRVNSEYGLTVNLTFKADGTYTGNVEVGGKANGSFSGKWAVKEGMLLYEYTQSTDPNIPAGTKDEDRIIEINKDSYIIESALGRETYYRVKE